MTPNNNTTPQCCERCKGQRVIADTDGNTIPACHFCPCHTDTNNTTPVEEWEIEFEERFGTYNLNDQSEYAGHTWKAKDFLKDFIRSTITLREERAREEAYKAVEAEILDKIYYIGTELPQIEQDKRDKFVVLGYPAQFLRNARSRSNTK